MPRTTTFLFLKEERSRAWEECRILPLKASCPGMVRRFGFTKPPVAQTILSKERGVVESERASCHFLLASSRVSFVTVLLNWMER